MNRRNCKCSNLEQKKLMVLGEQAIPAEQSRLPLTSQPSRYDNQHVNSSNQQHHRGSTVNRPETKHKKEMHKLSQKGLSDVESDSDLIPSHLRPRCGRIYSTLPLLQFACGAVFRVFDPESPSTRVLGCTAPAYMLMLISLSRHELDVTMFAHGILHTSLYLYIYICACTCVIHSRTCVKGKRTFVGYPLSCTEG